MQRKWLIASLLLAITCASWSLASPLGSSSDDDFHLASIWCAQGNKQGRCEYDGLKARVRVPLPIAQAGICYLGDNEKSASCTNDELRSDSKTMVESSRDLSAYRVSLFYAFNGLFVTSNIELSILVMRLFNIVFLLGLFALARKAAPEDKVDKLILVLLVTCVPGALFWINSNNSSSWTFLGTGFAWFFAYQFVTDSDQGRRTWALAGLIMASVLGIGSRSESAVFITIQIVSMSVLGVLTYRDKLVKKRALILAPTSLLLGFLLYQPSNVRGLVENGFLGGDDESPIVRIGRHVFFSNFLSVSELYVGLLGGLRGIGGSATELTGTVRTLTTFVLGFVIITSLRQVQRAHAAYLAVLLAFIVAVPLYILQKNLLFVGEELVPRYLYPFLILAVGSMILLSKERSFTSKHQSLAVAIALGIAHAISLRINILRHTHGIDQYGVLNLDSGREWWWIQFGRLGPFTILLVGAASFASTTFISCYRITRCPDNS